MRPRASPVTPLLLFGWGNPSRGDDALGPIFVEQLGAVVAASASGEGEGKGGVEVEVLSEFQLQAEHALDLAGRAHVLFVDASVIVKAPFEVSELQPARDASFSTHAMSPQAVMQVFRQLHGVDPPPCTLLAIRGESFGLGEAPSEAALAHLALALAWGRGWLASRARFDATARAPCTN